MNMMQCKYTLHLPALERVKVGCTELMPCINDEPNLNVAIPCNFNGNASN